jgi:Holliday junction resolvasome RuvABC endonuclease subunit
LNGKGICTVKKTKQKEWEERLEALSSQIKYWIESENKTEKTVEAVQLYYDCD